MTASVRRLPVRHEGSAGWTQAVDAFLSARDLMPASVRSYRMTLDDLGKQLGGGRELVDVAAADVAAALLDRYGHTAPATFNRHRATAESFLRWCGRQGWCARDEHAVLADLVERRRIRRAAEPRAVAYPVLERLFTRQDVALRDRTLWRMLYETAARASEVLQLDVEDLDQPNRRALTIRKGGEQGTLTWSTGTARLLPRLLRGRTSGPVFLASQPTQLDRVPRAGDTCPVTGLPRLSYRRAAEVFTAASDGLTLHQLRHSAIVDLLEAGYSQPLVMAKSGHRSLRTFQVYARPSTDAVARMTDNLEQRRLGRG